MKVVAVYGGGFNPVHVGHALIASWIHLTGLADEVWFVPSFAHPYGKQMAPFEDRVRLCRLLCKELGPWAKTSILEQSLPEPNYTLDTLRAFAEFCPEHQYRFVMGIDNYLQRNSWAQFDVLERDFSPIVVDRATVEHDLELHSPRFHAISSTEVRDKIAGGLPHQHLLPKSVFQDIQENGLYKQKTVL